MKKILALIITLCIVQLNTCCLSVLAETPDVFQGHAEVNDATGKTKQDKIFTGETETIKSRDTINMSVSQVIGAGMSEEGDEFFAEVTNEVVGDKGVVLPLGTVAHGRIRNMAGAKRFGRDGWVELSFDYLVTPDGRQIPIDGKMSTKLKPVASIAKTVATDTAYSLAGGFVGGMTALNLFGIEGAVASQGYTVAGGAGVGAAIGLGVSLVRKGKDVLISPGDEIKVKMQSNLKLPVLSKTALLQDEIKYNGLDVHITNVKLEKDPFGELNTITLNLAIQNMSKTNFSTFDICLINDLGSSYYPSIFSNENSLAFAQIRSGDRVAGSLSFSVDNPKRKHWLVFYDRMNRKPLAKISVENAKREIEVNRKTSKKKHKKEKIKNIEKEESAPQTQQQDSNEQTTVFPSST